MCEHMNRQTCLAVMCCHEHGRTLSSAHPLPFHSLTVTSTQGPTIPHGHASALTLRLSRHPQLPFLRFTPSLLVLRPYRNPALFPLVLTSCQCYVFVLRS